MHLLALPLFRRALLCPCTLLLLASLVPDSDVLADQGPPLQISIAAPGISNEFSATPALSWTADGGVSYLIQVSTNIADPNAWQDADMTEPATAGPLKWMAPESVRDSKFYRLLTGPAVFDVEPAFISSDDTNAWLYLIGQMLPSNAIVSIDGHNFGMQHDSTGSSGDVWRVSLSGLPPDEPISGVITVLDAASNVIATLPVQWPIAYGTEMPAEQLQGPPDAPPACPARKEFKGHVTLIKAFDDNAGAETMSARGHTKSGHVTLLKAFDDGSEGEAAERGLPILVKPPPHCPSAFLIDPEPGPGGGGGGSLGSGDVTAARRLRVRNLGSSGQDGVDIELRRLPSHNLGSSGQDGIADFSGEARLQVTDLAIPGAAIDFEWTRSYRSRTGPATSQGAGWDFSYNVRLAENSDGTVTLHPGNGRADTFYPAGTNGWFRDEYFCQIIDLNGDGYPDVLFADSSRWLFNPVATGAAAGKLAQIIDRNGNTISLSYDNKGRLVEIVDDLGRTNTVAYNISGQISGVTDFSGRTVSYEYDGNGDLVSVISPPVVGTPTGDDFPSGITNRYTYTSGNADERLNHNLATCVDGKGQTWLQITYQATTDPSTLDFDRVDSATTYKSGGVVCACSHLRCYPQTPSPTNNFSVIKAVSHDGVGNVTECFYDSHGRCVRELDYTGRCNPSLPVTESSNRPTGKLRSDDPDYFETLWTWNADSLCTSETMPDGEVVQIMYQRAFNQNASRSNHIRLKDGVIDPTLHNGDVRVIRLEAATGGGDLDGDGVPDITELSWHLEYDPRFGTPLAAGGMRVRPRNWDGTIYKRGTGSSEALCSLGFVPEGNGVAINQKGTGADKGRSAGGLPDESIVPTPQGHAINTKGAGTNGRMAINVKGTGADKNRTAGGLPDGSVVPTPAGYAINTKGAGTNGRMKLTSAQPEIVDNKFCISITDPRGNVTTASYDGAGNLQSCQRKDGSVVAADYNYRCNSRGQLIAITNAPDPTGYRRVDAITYYSSGSQSGWPQSIAIDEPGVHLTSSFEYDTVGNLTRRVDPNGNDWLYSYNALNQCVSLQTPTNLVSRCTSTFGYDANGNCYTDVIEYKDGDDVITHTRPGRRYFDALDRCTSSVSQVLPGSLITNRFDYDANGNLTAMYSPMAVSGADPNAVAQFEYDERGLLFRATSPPSSTGVETNEYDYDGNAGCKRISSIDSFTWKQTIVSYDGFHRCVSATDPMGNVGTCTYDRNGNCTMVRSYGETNDAPGGGGNILLAQTQYTYDALDRCIQTRDLYNNPVSQAKIGKGLSATTYSYAPNGACSSVTDDNGQTTTYLYDTAMRLEGFVTPSRKAMMQWFYDNSGNLISETISNAPSGGGAAQMFTRSFSYDSRNRCVAASDNVGNTNRYVYDSFSRCVQATSPNGVQSWSSYDDLGRCTLNAADLDRDGLLDLAVDSWTSCAYDDNSRCVASTDGHTNTTYYSYDSVGNCIHVMNGDGSVLSLVWSPRSNLMAYEDPNGTTITNTYDLRDRIVHRDIAARNVLATTTFETFAYDGLDRCVSAANDSSTSTFAYDSLGDCLSSTQDGFTTTYSYDGVGNNLSITYPGGRVASYTYNEVNDVSTMSSTAPGSVQPVLLASYTYAGPGRLSGITRANGVTTTLQWDGQLNPGNAQDDYGWMQVRGISHASGGNAIDQRRNNFDRNQNLVLRAMAAPALASGLETNILAYDACDRLVDFAMADASATHQIDWSLDKLGNRIAETNDGTIGSYTSLSTIPPGDFQMNRYSSTPSETDSYDADGNMVAASSSAGPMLYAYDYANRLVQVSTMSGGSLSVVATYVYDALGRRVSRAVTSSGVPQTTTFIYGNDDCDDGNANDDESRVIEEHSNGSVKTTFVMPHVLDKSGILAKSWPCRWEMAMSSSLLSQSGLPRRGYVTVLDQSSSACRGYARPHVFETSGRVAFDADTTPRFLHQDDLGNLLAITDPSGNVLERYRYDAFGSPTFLTSDGVVKTDSTGATAKVSDFGMSRLFRAMFWEDTVGLYYASGDDEMPKECIDFYYAPSTGRSLGRVCTCPPGFYSAYDPFAGNPWSQPATYKTKPPKSTGSIKKDMTGHVTLCK